MRKVIVVLVLMLTASPLEAQPQPGQAPPLRTVRTVKVESQFVIGTPEALKKAGLPVDGKPTMLTQDKLKAALQAHKPAAADHTVIDALRGGDDLRLIANPKMTMYADQRAYIAVSSQQNYVRDVKPDDEAGAMPVIDTLQEGLILDLAPTITDKGEVSFKCLAPRSALLLGMRECSGKVRTKDGEKKVAWQEPVLLHGNAPFDDPSDIRMQEEQTLAIPLVYTVEQGCAAVRGRIVDGKVKETYEPVKRDQKHAPTERRIVVLLTVDIGPPIDIGADIRIPDFEGPTFELQPVQKKEE